MQTRSSERSTPGSSDSGVSQTPMIAMSASSFMVRTAKATGLFQETISKPFDVGEFLATVERCLA